MKKLVVLFINCLILFPQVFSQRDSIFYYDKYWAITTNRKVLKYYRVIFYAFSKQKIYRVTDYYASGNKQMEGYIEDLENETKTGKHNGIMKTGK